MSKSISISRASFNISSDGFEYKGKFNEGKYDYDGNMKYTSSPDFIGNEGELYNNGISLEPIKLFDPPPILPSKE